ncbi:(2Fe-2S)-binding protein [Fusobacterium sp.]|uniref:(2Fe-2S)-binding protein n=1 Tax=Fusobacterium sp. TaxID=68766 RepID=UPI0026156926|nr:(2Fe-2S)-binding protein [Fusobacterium sp.]
MKINFWLNGKKIEDEIEPDTPLLEYVRSKGCLSVKRGCETSNCGLCTLWIDEKPVLSCTVLAVRANGKKVTTLEGLQEEAKEFGKFMAEEGADQCGYCNPGFIMNVLAMVRELKEFTDEDIKEYLVGNLCRCTGYMGQFRAVKKFLDYKKGGIK